MNAQRLLQHFDRIAEAPDAVPRLRRFILDLVVRGKLVEQDPNDEPAAELLKRIQAEKARLVKEGKIKKHELPPQIEGDELPFEPPLGWCWASLGAISRRIHYGFTAAANQSIKDVRLLRITDIQNNSVEWSSVPGCEISEREICQYKLEQGDILIARTGGTIGKSFLVRQMPVTAVFASYLIRVQGPPELYDQYLKLFLESPVYWKQLQDGARGGGQPNVNGQTLGRMTVMLPPVAEQHRIVAKVDELMALCDRLETAQAEREIRRDRVVAASLNRLNNGGDAESFRTHANFHLLHLPRLTTRPEHVRQLRKTILNLAVCGRLVPQDPNDEPVSEAIERIRVDKAHLVASGKSKFEKPLDPINQEKVPFGVPEGWAWKKIDTIVRSLRNDIRTGPFGSSLHKDEHRGKGVPVWGIESINKNGSFNGKNKIYVDAEKARELSSFAVNGGDIIISRSGTVGELCRLPDDAPHGLLSTNLMKISLDKQVVSPDYFHLLFKGAESIDAQLAELCSGSTRLFLTQSILTKLLFPLPPLAEQHRIVVKVDQLMARCDRLESQLTTTQVEGDRFREAVLHCGLAGQQQILGAANA